MALRLPKRPEGTSPDSGSAHVQVSVDEPITREMLAAEAATPGQVSHGIALAAGWFWRLLVIAAGCYGLWFCFQGLSQVTVPLFVALLLAAALWPLRNWFVRKGMGPAAAAGASLLAMILLVVAIFALVGAQIASQSSSLAEASVKSYEQFMGWLASGPLQLHEAQIDAWTEKGIEWAKSQQSVLTGYAAAAGAQVGHFFAGIALALFALFYFLYEGRSFARGTFSLLPRGSRARIADASAKGWTSLVSYVRAAVIVAAVDGLGAGLGAALVGSDLFLAIGALTFITAFVPLLGAFTAGLVSTSVVLLTLGWVKALIMLGVFTAVMQLEAHVLQPFLLGKAVSIHPLAVLYGIAIGTVLAGIVGALFAVPILAFGNAFVRALRSHAALAEHGVGDGPTTEDTGAELATDAEVVAQ